MQSTQPIATTETQQSQQSAFPISYQQFKELLRAQPAEMIVGYACDSQACPLVFALKQRLKVIAAHVFAEYALVIDVLVDAPDAIQREHRYQMPQWAQTFIERVDEDPHAVTTAAALEILATIPNEEAEPAITRQLLEVAL